MNTKFIRILFFLFLLMQGTALLAQRNIFRSGNVTFTASLPLTFGTFANFNDGNLTNYSYFSKPASDQVELTMECAVPEKLTEYTTVFFGTTYLAREIVLSGSQNGTVWTVLNTKTGVNTTTNNVIVANTTSYKFYKFTFKSMAGTLLVINEVSAWSDAFLAPELTTTPGATGNRGTVSWTPEIRGTGSYELERSADRINFKLLKTFDQSITSYTEDSLIRNTAYWYRIRAKKGDVYTPYSAIKELITVTDVLTAVPTLTATASPSTSTTANLSWSLAIGGPGGFEIERSENGTDFALIKTLDKAVTTYADNTLKHNTTYWYRIRGKNDISTSPYSTVRSITTINDALLTAPALNAVAPTGTQANLSWSLSFNTTGGFELEKSTNGTDFVLMGKLDKSVTSYTEESLSLNTSYWYRIRAYNYLGSSPYSAIVKVTTNGIKGLPADITDDGGKLTVSAENSGGATAAEGSPKLIDNNLATKWLVFNAQTGQNLSAVYEPTGAYIVTGYAIGTANDSAPRDPKNWRFEGSDNNTDWSVLDTRTNQLGAAAERLTLYNYSIANPGTKAFKFYRIAFTSNNGSTDIVRYQISEWQIFGLDPSSPEIPAGLTASNATVNALDLSWTQDNAIAPAKKFVLQRSEDGLYFNLVDTLESTILKYTDKNLYDGATYYYRIKALGEKATAVSGWSNVATAKTLTTAGAPLTPAYLNASAIVDTVITLSWTDRSTDETGFSLERSRDNVTFTEIKSLPPNTTTYADETVWPGTYFYYRIRAVKDQTKSAYSNVLKVLTTGINTAPLAKGAIIPHKLCTGTGSYRLAINGISPGPAYESIQKLTVTGVKAADEESAKFFSSFSFSPELADGTVFNKIETIGKIANFSVTTTGLAVPGDSATVLVTIKDDGGTIGFASDSTEFAVKIYFTALSVKITADKDTKSVSRYSLVNLTAASNFPENTVFEWANAEGIEGSRNGIKLRVRPKQTTTYTLKVSTPGGCSATASITLSPQDTLVVANVLTPNGDGKNDTWQIWGLENIPNNEVKVYDRQGRIVFRRKGYNNDWDGTYNSSILPSGGYYYVIDTNDGKKPQTGVLMIIK